MLVKTSDLYNIKYTLLLQSKLCFMINVDNNATSNNARVHLLHHHMSLGLCSDQIKLGARWRQPCT